MLKSVHLVGEEETEDLYDDFENEHNPAYDTEVSFSHITLMLYQVNCFYENLCNFPL